jgi:hypothetical protein
MNTAKIYHDSDGNECSIMQMVKREPYWAANRIQEGEKAIEELASFKASQPVVAVCSKCGLEHHSHMSAANCCR